MKKIISPKSSQLYRHRLWQLANRVRCEAICLIALFVGLPDQESNRETGSSKQLEPARLLGFRAAALHSRLYSVALIRGIGFDTRISSINLGNDEVLTRGDQAAAEIGESKRHDRRAAALVRSIEKPPVNAGG